MVNIKKFALRIGDNIKVISGSDKDKIGEITKIYPKTGRIIIKGINFKFKHIKPNKENEVGEIKRVEVPIHHSNVKLIENES